ncbi:MAG: 4-hydroxy-tetrahydrodipicolinate reductase [Eubacteriaceae bacterium]|nr:4-hydroxy-tetrahydrodipicolinate reductase [Eubacteriaceae bacterium]
MRLLVSGLGGHMGRLVADLAMKGYRGASLAGGVDPAGAEDLDVPCFSDFSSVGCEADIVVDFSHHSVTKDLLAFCVSRSLPVVIATTGQTDEEKQMIKDASEKIPVFFASNFSMGIALLSSLVKQAARVMDDADIEIIETHHIRKADAPSGTALSLAEAVQEVRPDSVIKTGRSGFGVREHTDIGIQSVRMGNVAGIHEVIIGTQTQTLTLRHEVHDRSLFAEGALAAAEFLMGQENGLYDMGSLVSG